MNTKLDLTKIVTNSFRRHINPLNLSEQNYVKKHNEPSHPQNFTKIIPVLDNRFESSIKS